MFCSFSLLKLKYNVLLFFSKNKFCAELQVKSTNLNFTCIPQQLKSSLSRNRMTLFKKDVFIFTGRLSPLTVSLLFSGTSNWWSPLLVQTGPVIFSYVLLSHLRLSLQGLLVKHISKQ